MKFVSLCAAALAALSLAGCSAYNLQEIEDYEPTLYEWGTSIEEIRKSEQLTLRYSDDAFLDYVGEDLDKLPLGYPYPCYSFNNSGELIGVTYYTSTGVEDTGIYPNFYLHDLDFAVSKLTEYLDAAPVDISNYYDLNQHLYFPASGAITSDTVAFRYALLTDTACLALEWETVDTFVYLISYGPRNGFYVDFLYKTPEISNLTQTERYKHMGVDCDTLNSRLAQIEEDAPVFITGSLS